ncbi:hypothetical protein GCM10009836_61180 [Pseudonocardia ailaonensis]|uniref:Putative 4-hydroxy-4-methyl-2-oxoglutarate aldolase n=1 Tax=Pseudonocardia ailaonensis TaxID=367279 RepID=A0ABN2NJH4_9PSEU
MTDLAAMVAELRQHDTCVLSDALDRAGVEGVAHGLGPLTVDQALVGRVRTMQLAPDDGTHTTRVHLGAAVILRAGSDEVIVIAGGSTEAAGWGGLLTRGARQRGVAGVVIDGASRDIPEARGMTFPIYGRAATPTSARKRLVETAVDQPVVVAGVPVDAGDYVVADASGVVFIPGGRIAEILSIAGEIARAEQGFVSELKNGTAIDEVLDLRYETLTAAGKAAGERHAHAE